VIEQEFRIVNKRGLHARAAARFVHLATTFDSEVVVSHESEEADGKSILSLMVLGAGPGTTVKIKTEGPDEAVAMEQLGALIGGGFDERD
jgi:phosphocarrier protein HPr